MNPSDHDLLRQYAEGASEAAFAELVRRHLNLVYSAARRQMSSAHLAEEVAQAVFIDLARHAARLKADVPVVAWLHVVTRRTAIDLIRRESRRRAREQAALEVADMKPTQSVWTEVEPLLDEALDTLNQTDRSALLLRFFENKSLRDVGETLGTSEDAAQKRVTRAVDQLRTAFLRRGIAVTTAGLVTDLSAHAMQTAPAALGATISSSAALSGAALGHAAFATTRTLALTVMKKSLLAAALVALLGTGVYETTRLVRQRRALSALQSDADRLSAELSQMRRERTATRQAAAPGAPTVAADTALEPDAQAWLARVKQLKQLSTQRPELTIPEMQFLTEDDWLAVARYNSAESEGQIRHSFLELRNAAKSVRFAPRLREALNRYVAVHSDTLPETSTQLASFFDPPIDPTVLQRYQMLRTGKASVVPGYEWLLEEIAPVDEIYDNRIWLQANGSSGSGSWNEVPSTDLRQALGAFLAANSGQWPGTPAQLLPFFSHPMLPAAQKHFLAAPPEEFTPEALQRVLHPPASGSDIAR